MFNISRGSGIFDPKDHKKKLIHIIGLGNIGSHVAIALTRMGFENFALYDFDSVEDVNISTQAFYSTMEGTLKIEAVMSQMQAINPYCNVTLVNEELTEDSKDKIVDDNSLCFIIGVDSLAIRKTIKDLLMKTDQSHIPVIDGRLGKQQVEVLFSKNVIDWNIVVEESVLTEAGCTEKYIAYTPLMCAALISGTMKKLCSEEHIPAETMFEFASNMYLTHNYESNEARGEKDETEVE